MYRTIAQKLCRSSNRCVALLNLVTELLLLLLLFLSWRWIFTSGLATSPNPWALPLMMSAIILSLLYWWWAGNLSTCEYDLVGTWVPDPIAVLGPLRSAPIFVWRICKDRSEYDEW